jgi:Ni,Fe-hydrogenase III small subunit
VAREPEERPAPVRVRVPYDQMSATVAPPPETILETAASSVAIKCLPIVPAAVIVEVAKFQTLNGIVTARDEDAERTVAFTALVTFAVCVLVLAFTIATTEEEAVVRSERVAREPEERVASVRVRLPYDQILAAVAPPPEEILETAASRVETRCFPIVPMAVIVDVAKFQTLNGIEVARDEEAARTVALVLVLILEAREVDAFVMSEPIEVEAVRTAELVFSLTRVATVEDDTA